MTTSGNAQYSGKHASAFGAKLDIEALSLACLQTFRPRTSTSIPNADATLGPEHTPIAQSNSNPLALPHRSATTCDMQRYIPATTAFVLLLTLLTLAPRALAQCEGRWLPGMGVPGVDGVISAFARWDPDGPGPEPELLVIGGNFTLAGSTPARNIAAWDGTTFRALGSGLSGTSIEAGAVAALAVMPDNTLVAGGGFDTAGGVPAMGVARWNGQAWSPMPGLTNFGQDGIGWVRALLVTPTGDLIAGGTFTRANGTLSPAIARWNGQAWQPMGSGFSPGIAPVAVFALSLDNAGRIVAAGQFSASGSTPLSNIAAWNNTSWVPLGSGTNGFVTALKLAPDGSLLVGGGFNNAGGVSCSYIARWNGSAYSAMIAVNGVFNNAVRAIDVLSNGDIIAGGFFQTTSAFPLNFVARWNGSSWSRLSTGTDAAVRAMLVLPDDSIVIGGSFNSAGGAPALHLARWSQSAWTAFTTGWDTLPFSFTLLPSGEVLMAGPFKTPGGIPSPNFVRWNGAAFIPAGATLSNGQVNALHTTSDGRVFAGGTFTSINSVSMSRIAQLNGSQWVPVGSGANNSVLMLTSLPNGHLVAGGAFTAIGGVTTTALAAWNGATWYSLGTQFQATPQGVLDIITSTLLPDGSLLIGGKFAGPSPQVPALSITRFDGSTWQAMGSGLNNYVMGLDIDTTGAPVASGTFTNPGAAHARGPARWNGSAWEAIGPDSAPIANGSIVTLPDGSFVIATNEVQHIHRWDGVAWAPLGSGLNGQVSKFFLHPSGELLISGSFTLAGNVPSAWFARWSTSNHPWFAIHPQPQLTTTCSQPATFSVTPASGYDNLSFRWQIEDPIAPSAWRDLADGALFFLEGPTFGTVTGSATPDLTLSIAVNPGPVKVRCLLSNPCFTRESNSGTLFTAFCCGSSDFNGDGDFGAEADIESFFACLAGNCCANCFPLGADFNADGDTGTDADIESFFRVLAGGNC